MNITLRVGVIGAGHFGRYHALKIRDVPGESLSGLFDPDPARARLVASEAGCPVVADVDTLLAQSDAVVVAAPAEFHFDLAVQALRAGRHVLVEKPVAATLEQADMLVTLARQSGLVCQVGHLLRYSAEHEAISRRITRPLYIEATRIAPYKPRGTDVSVILDLMIHDLDLVLALVDSPIAQVDALGAAVSSEYEDIANARVRFENGCVATITASRISLKTERRMRLFSEEGYLSADFVKRELSMIGRERGLPLPGTGGFKRESISWKEHDSLFAEHQAFVASCVHGAPVVVDAVAGRRALAAALAVADGITTTRNLMEQSGLIRGS
ncbi:gfo/Idh/MocA family oxidoreductase [Acetobacter lambici]|uniref:Gfo/Idh/MocA family oxidoreductase n=1 Tax=Acetobacter lambici TaxID=1332824 RepID=A0ABT1EYQ3_9PROT|nr:Gfo/Idh/MocA family oxidoreductase [Acetobacter lambici]MCP1241159.1 Gfo/Idh/MocA family oxidoreductase [Acetobacter lambici]MCP1257169.1 Gfo/Idh/MocA family oxidoreductase [Acetobacter lambici]NHO55661.1 gfo/Idh/MocA family oxidoreductase [Acetobacter lambici]